jgi:hypothetical protein
MKMTMRVKILGIVAAGSAALFAILPNESAWGSIDTWTFDGIITTGLPGSPYTTGKPYSALFELDTTLLSPVASGLYFPITGYGFYVGGSGFGGGSPGGGVLIVNDQPLNGGGSFDGIIFSYWDRSQGFPSGTRFDGSDYGITLVNDSIGSTAGPFIDTSFPSTLDLNQFSQRYMTEYFSNGEEIEEINGSVDSLYLNGVLISQVPEPSFVNLFALNVLLFGWQLVFWRKSTIRDKPPFEKQTL